jgi:hypothetical protein
LDIETKYHWRAVIGFSSPDDLEWNWDPPHFYIQGYCAAQYFDDLIAAVRRGHVDTIRVGMETTMWTRDKHVMFRAPMTWHLAPPIDCDATHHAIQYGSMSSLIWEEKFGFPSANEAKDVTAPKPQVVKLPTRVYSMLSALLVIATVLLALMFLRY